MDLKITFFVILLFPFVKSVAQTDTVTLNAGSPGIQKPKISLEYSPYTDLTPKNATGTFSIDVDQDYFLDWWPGKNKDRNYTQGTAFSFSKYDLEESPIFYPMNLLGRIISRKFDKKEIVKFPSTISMGVTAFTPLDIADSLNPVIGDRPFANVVFLTTTKNKYNNVTKLFTSTSFSYGFIGSNIGNTFQSNAHTVITGRPTNIGWQYQISRGGYPAFLFSHLALKSIIKLNIKKYDNILKNLADNFKSDTPFNFDLNDKKSELAKLAKHFKIIKKSIATKDTITIKSAVIIADIENKEENKSNWFQLSLGYKLNLGWYTGLATVASFRIGKFSKFSNIFGMNNALSSANEAPQKKEQKLNDSHIIRFVPGFLPWWRFEWYFFGMASPRMTPYNSLLLGQPGVPSVYTLPKENYNPFVLDFEGGLVLSWLKTVTDVHIPLKNIDVVLSVNGRTSEIISKDPKVYNPYKRTHYWGRISFRFPLSLF